MTFEDFWKEYPRKVSKKKAQEVWKKAGLDEMGNRIVEAVKLHVKHTWKGKDGAFIPHPATWLNQERWTDDVVIPATAPSRVPDWKGPAYYSEGLEPEEIRQQFVAWVAKDPLKRVAWFAAGHRVLGGQNPELRDQIGQDLRELVGEEEFRRQWRMGRNMTGAYGKILKGAEHV